MPGFIQYAQRALPSRVAVQNKLRKPTWVAPGQRVVVQGHSIVDGLFYLRHAGDAIDYPFAIDDTLPIGKPMARQPWCRPRPHDYLTLTPNQRGAYLQWLAIWRRDGPLPTWDSDCLSLFIQGLEWHVVTDRSSLEEVLVALGDLLEFYPRVLNELPILRLIHLAAHLLGSEFRAPVLEALVESPNLRLQVGVRELSAVIAALGEKNRALPADVAYRVIQSAPSRHSQTDLYWFHPEMREEFLQEYAIHYPEGIPIAQASTFLDSSYAPLCPLLRGSARPCSTTLFEMTVPHVLKANDFFPDVTKLWNELVEGRLRKCAQSRPAIPPKPAAAFCDAGKVKALATETAAVQEILNRRLAQMEPLAAAAPDCGNGPLFQQLDVHLPERYRKVLLEIVRKNWWEQADFRVLTKKHGLMPGDVYSALNTWATDTRGDLLLSDEGGGFEVNANITLKPNT